MPEIDLVDVGLRIRQLRERRRLSSDRAAQLAGRSGRWLQDIEAGRAWKAKFTTEDANRLADVLSVSAIELLVGSSDGMNRRDLLKVASTAPLVASAVSLTTLGLAFDLMGSRVDPAVVQHIGDETFRLGQLYPLRPPEEMRTRLQSQLEVVNELLHQGGARLPDHARLLESAGWLCLLLAMTHYDLHEFSEAAAARDTALGLGRETQRGDLIGWAFDTAAWFATYEGSSGQMIDASQAGAELSPPGSPAQAMNLLKLGVGMARAGRERDAMQALERAEAVASRMPPPANSHHQFEFDVPNRLDMFAVRIYRLAGRPSDAETRARRAVTTAIESRATLPPTREPMCRLDLAAALIAKPSPDVEEACAEIARALAGPIVRYDWVVQGGQVLDALDRRALGYPPVKHLRERLQDTAAAIGRDGPPDPRSRPRPSSQTPSSKSEPTS